jgi:biopolymer transport protein ExbD
VPEAPTVNETHALNIVLSGHNKIYWYIGLTNPKVYATDYSETGIRKVLQDQNKSDDKLVVLIKPDQNSTYENLVDILNEMAVSDVQRYVLADLEDDDKVIIQKYLTGSNN